MSSKAVVVLSGGQDSTTCLNWAKTVYDEVHAITFNYGQRHARELQAAADVAKLCGVASHEVVVLGPILHGRSPLTNPNEQLEQYTNFEQMDEVIGDRVELTFVPMRNELFLSIAANRAACIGADAIITGVCQADNANYPDCRQIFIDKKAKSINYALGADLGQADFIAIITPLMDLSKAESVRMAYDMDHEEETEAYPMLAFTHTAYDGQYPPVGKDHATILRAHGFEEAKLPDPLVVRAWAEGLMELPTTTNYLNVAYLNNLVDKINSMKARLQA